MNTCWISSKCHPILRKASNEGEIAVALQSRLGNLGGNVRNLGRHLSLRLGNLDLRSLLGSFREVGLLDRNLLLSHLRSRNRSSRSSGRRGAAPGGEGLALCLSNHFLGLVAVLISVHLQLLLRAGAVLGSELFELIGLLVQEQLSLAELLVDELLVLDVDERAEVDDERGN